MIMKVSCFVPAFSQRRRPLSELSGWKKSALLTMSTFALLASAKVMAAGDPIDPSVQHIGSGSPIRGKEKSDSGRCQECHGVDGISTDAKVPHHAGQIADYLIKQLKNFQSGERSHQVMTVMAEDLSTEDIADIAAYFASQKPMQGDKVNRVNPVAYNLFNSGDQARGIPACNSCHGVNGKGKITDTVVYPMIGGQREIYLRGQLVNWKLNERHNSPEGVMNKVAQLLNEDEIDALAYYISGL
jgi:cytochrome c553